MASLRLPQPPLRRSSGELVGRLPSLGIVRDKSRTAFLDIMNSFARRGARAVIQGCTEIGMLVEKIHPEITLFDATRILPERAVAVALA